VTRKYLIERFILIGKMQGDKPSPQVKKDIGKDSGDQGGLLYHQLRKLISIVVSILLFTVD
jgi:hypothetical protein